MYVRYAPLKWGPEAERTPISVERIGMACRFSDFRLIKKYRARLKGGPQVWRIFCCCGFAGSIHATWGPLFS